MTTRQFISVFAQPRSSQMQNTILSCKALTGVQLFSFDDPMRRGYPRLGPVLCPAQESAYITGLFHNFAEFPARRRPVRHGAGLSKGHCGRPHHAWFAGALCSSGRLESLNRSKGRRRSSCAGSAAASGRTSSFLTFSSVSGVTIDGECSKP
jgi:hypothetical protein